MSTAVTTTATPQPTALAPSFGAHMQLTSLADALSFAGVVEKSGLAPKGMTKEGIVIAMQMGYEVGLSPLQAVQNIASINGRPAIWGDACLALIRASGLMEWIKEEAIGDPGTDSRGYRCTVKRQGNPEASDEFTVADAKRAGLWGKQGPWSQYPQRMLRFRARGFILRDQFGDVLKGLRTAEEVADDPSEINVTAAGTDVPVAKLGRAAKRAEPAKPEDAPAVEPAKPAAANPVPYTATAAEAAIKGAGLALPFALDYLKAMGKIDPGASATLADASQELLAAIVERPGDLAKAVSAWVDERDAAATAAEARGER